MNQQLERMWQPWPSERVLYQDDDLLVVDKPAHLQTQAGEDGELADLVSRLKSWLAQTGEAQTGEAQPYLGLLYPVDRDASGVIVLTKRRQANRSISEQLARGLGRRYIAGVTSMGRLARPAKRCFDFEVQEQQGPRRLLQLSSQARSQPVRRELAQAGAALAGDRDQEGQAAARLMLHISQTSLNHPTSGDTLNFEAPLPAAMRRWLNDAPSWPMSDEELDARLAASLERRHGIALSGDSDAFRLVNGEGDELAGVEVDLYGDFAVVGLRPGPALEAREQVLDAVARLGLAGVYLKVRAGHAKKLVTTRTEDLAPAQAVRGVDAPAVFSVKENDIAYRVQLGDGLSTGIFLDQRAARKLIRADCAGKRVLNLFAYHGAFTVAAICGGAASSVTLDYSATALTAAAENIEAAGGDPKAHQTVRADALKWLESQHGKKQGLFDLIMLDPPSYSTTKTSTFRAARDYRKLAAAALACLPPGGQLLASTNYRGTDHAKFRKQLELAAQDAGVRLKAVQKLPPPVDYPPSPGKPHHLTRLVVTVAT